MNFAEPVAASNFSFLRGASHPADLVTQAIVLGLSGIGIADRNSVAGVVRAHAALRDARESLGEEIDFKLAVGARLVFADETPDIVAYPANRKGWANLCRLLTLGNRRAEKGECILGLEDLLGHAADLLLICIPAQAGIQSGAGGWTPAFAGALKEAAPGRVWLAATMHRKGPDSRRLAALRAQAQAAGVPLIATNDVLYHEPGQRPLQDILSCIREKKTIASAGRLLEANAERHIKAPAEMLRLFRGVPEAIVETTRLFARIDFSLDQLRYEYPHEPVPPGWTPQQWLEHLTWEGAAHRYPDGVPDRIAATVREEFALIAAQDYTRYFLTVYDIVRFAQSRGILNQGRGSAANSAVCYMLGITAVDPMHFDLLFSRFVSEERREPPDIDVDFEHERREEVIQYLYERYGRHRAGIAATVIRYRRRSAIRDVGKALGLSEDVTARLSSTVWGSWNAPIEDCMANENGFDPRNPMIQRLFDLGTQLLGFPRHLSQHVGGFVLTEGRLDEMVPIGNAAMEDRTFIEWDKDDIDSLGLMKVDVLALGMLTCIRKTFDLMREQRIAICSPGTTSSRDGYDLALVPQEDPAVYAMLQRGDSIGVFQVESRAQINMLPRLKPKTFYDLVIQVAIVRPGPIEGDMVHPYLRRRAGREKVEFPAPALEHGDPGELEMVLGRTLGVPLFQEQAMKLAIVAAKFTPSEANKLRRAMATFRNRGGIDNFRDKMVGGMVARGYAQDFAERCFKQIEGFGSYGFPESHAASFANLVYVSAWIKCHHPAVFACALLNSQPMGFYAPAQIIRDAREHGVVVRGIDVNASDWDNGLEPSPSLALRLGFRQISGFREEWADRIVAARPFADIETLARRAALPSRALRLLADADGFRSIGLDRRRALWEVRRIPDAELPLFAAAQASELGDEPDAGLPVMPLSEHIAADYQMTRLSLKGHPMELLRSIFRAEGVASCAETAAAKNGAAIRTAGVVLVRQRPGKGNAIFVTIEDETGITNIVLWARLFEMFRREVMASRLMLVEGHVQRSPEGVVHLMATRVHDRTQELARLSDAHVPEIQLSGADEFAHPQYPRGGHPRDARILPKSRDFH